MHQAAIIDGKALAQALIQSVRVECERLSAGAGLVPGLAVVLVGDDPASHVYVRNKIRTCREVGIRSFDHPLPSDTSQGEILELIDRLNTDNHVHGILVQMPLPRHIDSEAILSAIRPEKDVDGFHVVNVGKLASGSREGLVPCTPVGCVHLIKSVCPDLTGRRAVIVGRSNIVGKPLGQLLLREDCTVTIAHSKTHDLPAVCRTADILVAAVGKPRMIQGSWIKKDAIVIDVGINRIDVGGGKTKLQGDVDFDAAVSVASAVTPVPGGVGPMTIACLLRNTLIAACRSRGLPASPI